MITSQDKELISRLIKKYSANLSTGAMIAFVADTNGMLSICKTLVSSNNNDDQITISWVDEQCHERYVDVRGFLYEVEQILSLFQPGHKIDENYSILNLESGASDEEIKHAYRQLSRKYHPDTAMTTENASGEKFDKVTKAYQALLNEEQIGSHFSTKPPVNHWREQKNNHVSRERKKKSLLWFTVLATVLIVVSLIVASNYRKKVMIAGLQSTRAAFIPPDPSVSPPLQEDETERLLIDEKEPSQLIEIKKEKIDIPVEDVVKIEGEIQHEVERQVVLLGENPPSSDAIEIKITQIKTPIVKPAKKKEPFADTETANSVKDVKQKVIVSTVSKMNEPVVKSNRNNAKMKKQESVTVIPETPLKVDLPTVREARDHTQRKIKEFLFRYTKSYEDKDLMSFTRFFDLDAIENGEPLSKILPTYSDLFQKSETIMLDISILKWGNPESFFLHIEGRFKIIIRYKTGDTAQGAGSISFLMRAVEEQLSIKEITYKFDN